MRAVAHWILCLVIVGCKADEPGARAIAPASPKPATVASTAPKGEPMKESIGTATLEADGTIVLELRAEAADGTVGHGELRYPKEHKDYEDILRHLGGLQPGEVKAVAPWPD